MDEYICLSLSLKKVIGSYTFLATKQNLDHPKVNISKSPNSLTDAHINPVKSNSEESEMSKFIDIVKI